MDTSTPTGKLMLTVLGGIAQFEREMMLERQREGVAKAKAAGKYKGRKPTSDTIRQEVIRLAGEGTTKAAIASQLRIGEANHVSDSRWFLKARSSLTKKGLTNGCACTLGNGAALV
jgi:DNA invertase Pin-like site-specific DNA recombinase